MGDVKNLNYHPKSACPIFDFKFFNSICCYLLPAGNKRGPGDWKLGIN